MKNFYLLLGTILLVSTLSYAQGSLNLTELKPLTETELLKLASIPAYTPVIGDRSVTMPASIDNTLQPYFRPLFNQSGLECGQAASIGLTFTYEIDCARNLAANISQNQYATHFTYNFINGGSDAGVSYFETWEIVKRCGTPTSAEYGGLSTGGPARWMTGYDKYYNAMQNRISDVYAIDAGDAEGLNTLKNWIFNHSNTSATGGLANIYIQYKTPDAQLATGTPEAGKWVITTWGSSPNHAVTLVGYNDSIRYDYNNDGLYTNNIDINGDGLVNMKDWEIGGFKIANTYGGINNWGDQGFSFMMYKTMADNLGSGGVWNHAAHIVKVKQQVTPKLTFKVTLKHTSRNKLRIKAGVSQNPLATEPDALLNLPIFDLQGGDKYMLGGVTETDKTIEFGLDATPLLSSVVPGQAARFFLMLSETDPSAAATGQITSFSLIDYNGVTTTIPCSSSNVPIVENGLTVLTINHTPNHSRPTITNTILPEAKIYEPYSQQLNASGGNPLYSWKLMSDYTETNEVATFPTVTAQQLTVSNSSGGFAEVNLPFEFLFYGKKYTKLYAHVDGYLMFQPDLMPWTFIIYEKTFFKNTPNISPYMSKPLTLYSAEGDGIWYEGNANFALFRWKSGMYGSGPTTDLNFAVKIFPDGKIEFYYGSIVSNDWVKWNAGISNGDGVNYRFSSITDVLAQPAANSMFRFTTQPFPTEMSLSDEGLFSGTPLKEYNDVPIRFYAEDNNNLFATKTLNFSTKGISIEYSINSGGDSIIEFGETALMTAKLTNTGNTALSNVILRLYISDPYISLVDSVQNIGLLNAGQSITVPNALAFQVSNQIPDGHEIITTSEAFSTTDITTRVIPLTAYAPNLKMTALSVEDGNNNILLPGESGILHVTVKNTGGATAVNINALLTAVDPFITITQANATILSLAKNAFQIIDFQVTVSSACPFGHVSLAALNLTADQGYSANDSVYFTVGIVAEDFETGNFLKYPWQSGGNAAWVITNSIPYEGAFCAASPVLDNLQQSSLFVVMDVLCPSEISFYRKVSSETNYDFLTFYIDGVEQGKWSGEVPWSKITYNVSAGSHTFTWRYSKDVTIASGSDKAWVDYIVWPPDNDLLLIANAGPDDFVCHPSAYTMQGIAINQEYLFWSSSGDGYFDNNNMPSAVYHPGNNDLSTGTVTLTMQAGNAVSPPITDSMLLSVHQTAVATAGPDASICSGNNFTVSGASASVQPIQWSTSGDGTFNNIGVFSPVYTPGPNDISNGAAQLTLTAFGSVQCGNASDELLLTINPSVFADAGIDQSITYGTSTQLNGAATGGTGNFTINWVPADQLLNATVLNPITINLLNQVAFTLQVTDPATQCASSDEMLVNVTGIPLIVNASASPNRICTGNISQLLAVAGGGSGTYTYAWTSQPPGFTSVISNPEVSPLVTTVYYVDVNDGTNLQQASVTVTVDPGVAATSMPSGPASVNVLLTPSTTYTTIAAPPAVSYQWILSPVEAGTLMQSAGSCQVNWNPLFNGTADLTVAATNACGTGEFASALTIAASMFIETPDQPVAGLLEVYPNPGSGIFYIRSSVRGDCKISVTNPQGKLIRQYYRPNFTEKAEINLGDQAPGVYLITLETDNSRYLKRIVVIR